MILSILQLISALSLVNNPNTFSTLYNEGSQTFIPTSIYTSLNNTQDDLKTQVYYGYVKPLSNDFIESEWEKGLNMFNIEGGFPLHSGSVSYVITGSTITLSGSGWIGQRINVIPNSTICSSSSAGNFEFYKAGQYNSAGYLGGKGQVINIDSSTSEIDIVIFGNQTCSDIMVNEGSTSYAYQPYHSDSELFDIMHDENIFTIDLYDETTDTTYQNFISCWVSFHFTSRVQYNGSRYSYTLGDFGFGFNRRDYDQAFPNYPYLNYYIYSSFKYTAVNFNPVSYTSDKDPLIYSSTDSYDTMHFYLDDNLSLTSTDYIQYSLCFEYMNPYDMENMLGGLYGASTDYATGYQQGQKIGYDDGYTLGHRIGYDEGKTDGYSIGRQEGIAEGREQVIESGQTASVIFNGIISVGLLPTNVFLQMLNLEVFGINIGALVSSLLTIMVIIIIGRMLFGGKSEV